MNGVHQDGKEDGLQVDDWRRLFTKLDGSFKEFESAYFRLRELKSTPPVRPNFGALFLKDEALKQELDNLRSKFVPGKYRFPNTRSRNLLKEYEVTEIGVDESAAHIARLVWVFFRDSGQLLRCPVMFFVESRPRKVHVKSINELMTAYG